MWKVIENGDAMEVDNHDAERKKLKKEKKKRKVSVEAEGAALRTSWTMM